MSVKKILTAATFFILVFVAVPVTTSAITPGSQSTTVPVNPDPRLQQLIQRLEEIRGMERSQLTKQERKSLRQEVRGIKKEVKKARGGIYLSVGAIIVIILLLILIL
jgi:hypothetical protein